MKKSICIIIIFVMLSSLFFTVSSFASDHNLISQKNDLVRVEDNYNYNELMEEMLTPSIRTVNFLFIRISTIIYRLRTVFIEFFSIGTISHHTFLSFLRHFIFTIFVMAFLLVMLLITILHKKDGKKRSYICFS